MIKKTKLQKLNNPILIAAWPGMGNVALKAAHYLREELNAQEYQKIEPQDFFHIPMISIRNALIESIRLPESKFYFWKNKDGKNDLLIFLSEAQPIAGKGNSIFTPYLRRCEARWSKKNFYLCGPVIHD